MKAYKFSELTDKAKAKAIKDEIQFFITNWDTLIIKETSKIVPESKMLSYLYKHRKDYFIDMIESHHTIFTEDGKIFNDHAKTIKP